MSIVLDDPVAPGPIGPGIRVHISSDLIGPIPDGSQWIIKIWSVGGGSPEAVIWQKIFTPPDPRSAFAIVGIPTVGSGSQGIKRIASGADVQIQTTISHPSVGVIEDGYITGLTWDPTTNLWVYINEALRQNSNTFNSTDRANLNNVVSASFASFGSQLVPISQLLQSPPVGLLVRELIGDLSGEGTLTRPGGGFNVNAFGLAWEVMATGEGIGVDEGAPDTLETDMLDLQLVHTLADANNETTSVARFNYGDAMWLFSPMLPHEVKYWIGPSIVLRMYWLLVV